MKIRKAMLFIACLAMSLTLNSCAAYKEASEYFEAMDTFMSVKVYDTDKTKAEDAARGVRELIQQLDSQLSARNETGEIGILNSQKSAVLSDENYKLIKTAIDYSVLTEGAFDISIFPLVKLWGFGDAPSVPRSEDIEETLKYIDYTGIVLGQDNTVTLSEGQSIDLGAIAKGYAADRAVSYLKEQGIESAILSLGGNVYCLGRKNGNDSWNIAVEDPTDDRNYLCTIKLTEKAVVTSGGYLRQFTEDGKVYHHILDPKTGYPAGAADTGVTIICQSSTLADALSTGCFVMGREKAFELWKSGKEDFSIIWFEDGELWVSDDIAGAVESKMHFNTLKRY